MEAFPLKSLTIEEATNLQFKLVDSITHYFSGDEILTRGDLGVVKELNQPRMTNKVEKVLADFFNVEAAMLVRGSGTNAIRLALHAVVGTGKQSWFMMRRSIQPLRSRLICWVYI